METIRNYLESMFASLPNTPEVIRAKQELLSMMEDKYTELIESGTKENEAVGIVISEFGNLDELKETLQLEPIMEEYTAPETRQVTYSEAKEYINAEARRTFFVGIGVMLCIMSVTPTVLAAAFKEKIVLAESIGVSLMFIMIAVAVGFFIISANSMKAWRFLKEERCQIDYSTAEYINDDRQSNSIIRIIQLTIGIVLCIISVVPVIVIEGFAVQIPGLRSGILVDVLGPAIMFEFIGIGVLLIINSGGREKAYHRLLSLNDRASVAGNYESVRMDAHYDNPTLESFMSIYWKAITCIYLIWSFTSFNWGLTWIIWPVAGIVKGIIDKTYGRKGDSSNGK